MSLSDAYVAGLIDGEGCVYLMANKRARQQRQQRMGFTACVEIGMTLPAKPVLEKLHKQFKGSLHMFREATDKWSEAWHWRLTGYMAADLLRQISPYLVVKKEQAELVIMGEAIRRSLIPKGKTNPQWTTESTERIQELRDRIQELNAKGPRVPPNRNPFALLVGGAWVKPQMNLFGEMQWAPFSETWPTSGMISHGVAWTHSGLEWPNAADVCSLSDILEPEVDSKYFLSPKACAGILRRAEKRGRALPRYLKLALEQTAMAIETETE